MLDYFTANNNTVMVGVRLEAKENEAYRARAHPESKFDTVLDIQCVKPSKRYSKGNVFRVPVVLQAKQFHLHDILHILRTKSK